MAVANPATLFQVYWMGGRDRVREILDHARAGGARGIILTLDWTFAHRRDWGSPAIPERLDWKTLLKMAPEALMRPRWLLDFARAGGPPDLTVPNMGTGGAEAPGFFGAYGEWMMTPPPSWDDIAWMREQWDGPFLIKGVCAPGDARRAVEAGADAISVSNHGGNNLDGTPARSARCRRSSTRWAARRGPARRRHPPRQRRGQGAGARRARGDGRPRGPLGPRRQRRARRDERPGDPARGIEETLAGLGRGSLAELVREDVLVPPGFERRIPAGAATVS